MDERRKCRSPCRTAKKRLYEGIVALTALYGDENGSSRENKIAFTVVEVFEKYVWSSTNGLNEK